MASDWIIFYDEEFMANYEKLRELLEEENHEKTYRFLIDRFGFIFKMAQRYWNYAAEDRRDLEEADEEIRHELMRPLSHRQYRLIEGCFSRFRDEQDLVIWSIWDFLNDEDRIGNKKAMSIAEVSGCSIVLEEVYVRLDRKCREINGKRK